MQIFVVEIQARVTDSLGSNQPTGAALLESSGESGKIHISEKTKDYLEGTGNCTPRGEVELKGKGSWSTFFLEGLKSRGFDLIYQPEITNEELHAFLGNVHALVIKSAVIIDKELMDRFPNLHLVLRPGSGLDNVDLAEAKRRQIEVINSPDGNANASHQRD